MYKLLVSFKMQKSMSKLVIYSKVSLMRSLQVSLAIVCLLAGVPTANSQKFNQIRPNVKPNQQLKQELSIPPNSHLDPSQLLALSQLIRANHIQQENRNHRRQHNFQYQNHYQSPAKLQQQQQQPIYHPPFPHGHFVADRRSSSSQQKLVEPNKSGRFMLCYYTNGQNGFHWPKSSREFSLPSVEFVSRSTDEPQDRSSQVGSGTLINYEPFVTMPVDSDGQHQSDIPIDFLLASKSQPQALTLDNNPLRQQILFKSSADQGPSLQQQVHGILVAGGQQLNSMDAKTRHTNNSIKNKHRLESISQPSEKNHSLLHLQNNPLLAAGVSSLNGQHSLVTYNFIGSNSELDSGNNSPIVALTNGAVSASISSLSKTHLSAGSSFHQQANHSPVPKEEPRATGDIPFGGPRSSNHMEHQETSGDLQSSKQQLVFSPTSLTRATSSGGFIVSSPGNSMASSQAAAASSHLNQPANSLASSNSNNEQQSLDTKSHLLSSSRSQTMPTITHNNYYDSHKAVASSLPLYQQQVKQHHLLDMSSFHGVTKGSQTGREQVQLSASVTGGGQQQQHQHQQSAFLQQQHQQVASSPMLLESMAHNSDLKLDPLVQHQHQMFSSSQQQLIASQNPQKSPTSEALANDPVAQSSSTSNLLPGDPSKIPSMTYPSSAYAPTDTTPTSSSATAALAKLSFGSPERLTLDSDLNSNSNSGSTYGSLVASSSTPVNFHSLSSSSSSSTSSSSSSSSPSTSSLMLQPTTQSASSSGGQLATSGASLSSALVSSPLSTMFDVFGAASQYLMRFKPSSLMSGSSLTFNTIQDDHSSYQKVGPFAHLANNSVLHSDGSFAPLTFGSSSADNSHKSSQQSSSSDRTTGFKSTSAAGFLARLTGSQNTQRREDVCGRTIQSPERRIIGGEGARYGEFPYQVHIKIAKHQCGGALVDRQSIVTAAHCVYHFITRAPVSKLQIVIGAYDIEDEQFQELPPQYFKVNKVKLHPNFRFSASHPDRYDIAILKLDKPVKYTDNVLPVCLPTKDLKLETRIGTVTGFGKTDPSLSNRYGTRLLQKVDVPIIENNECERWHRTRGIDLKIFPEMMCAGYESGLKDACVGDSGGPLVVKTPTGPNGATRWTLAGITSAGFGCAQSRQPGIYHRVSHTVDWILENLD